MVGGRVCFFVGDVGARVAEVVFTWGVVVGGGAGYFEGMALSVIFVAVGLDIKGGVFWVFWRAGMGVAEDGEAHGH